MINSPLNYPGNKAKLVNEIRKFLPSDADQIIEVFAGSALISLNSNIKSLVLNDISKHTTELLYYFSDEDGVNIINDMQKIIVEYNFTDTFKNGNNFYKIEKNEGLSKHNKDSYNKLKYSYNKNPDVKKLFALIIFGFNHYIRFNSKGEFNVPVGKMDYGKSLREKTIEYAESFKSKEVVIKNLDFRDEQLYNYNGKNNFYYFDPPYLITTAPYNSYWKETDEKDLLNILDNLNTRGIKFALSNVIKSNGKENKILMEWSKNYNVIILNRQYKNANYRRKNETDTVEVLITNY